MALLARFLSCVMAVLKALLLAACAATAVLAENNSTPPGFDSAESGFINVPGFNDVNLFYWLTSARAMGCAPRPS